MKTVIFTSIVHSCCKIR